MFPKLQTSSSESHKWSSQRMLSCCSLKVPELFQATARWSQPSHFGGRFLITLRDTRNRRASSCDMRGVWAIPNSWPKFIWPEFAQPETRGRELKDLPSPHYSKRTSVEIPLVAQSLFEEAVAADVSHSASLAGLARLALNACGPSPDQSIGAHSTRALRRYVA